MNALLDLDRESRRALEFDALLELVAAEAATAAGRESVLGLRPLADRDALDREIGLVEETRDRCSRATGWVPGGLPDARSTLSMLGVEGALLEPSDLRDLALLLDAARRARSAVLESEIDYRRLRDLVASLPDLELEARPILEGVEPGGKIADRASSRLAECRARLTRLAGGSRDCCGIPTWWVRSRTSS